MLRFLLACAHHAEPAAEEPIAGPPGGTVGAWEALGSWLVHFNTPHLHAWGDSAYLLVDDRLYRSEDHGGHWALRSTTNLEDFARAGTSLLGWTGNEEAPLMASPDDGRHWYGRPVATYSGDLILTTGAIGSPRLVRVLGGHTLVVPPSDPDQLLVSERPPEDFVAGEFRFTPAYTAAAKADNRALSTTVQDAVAFGSALYACTSSGIFRSDDAARTWTQLSPPDGELRWWSSCAFATFDAPLCVAFGETGGMRMWCSDDGQAWWRADAGLFEETPEHAEWAPYVGLSYVIGTARLGGRWYLADRGDNAYAPRDEALYVTDDLHTRWSPVPELGGQRILDVTQTTRAVLVLTMGDATPDGVPVRLWRYRTE